MLYENSEDSGALGAAGSLKTGVWRSPAPLKDSQAAFLYAHYEDYEDSEDSGGLGGARVLKTGVWRSNGALKDLQTALLYADDEDYAAC